MDIHGFRHRSSVPLRSSHCPSVTTLPATTTLPRNDFTSPPLTLKQNPQKYSLSYRRKKNDRSFFASRNVLPPIFTVTPPPHHVTVLYSLPYHHLVTRHQFSRSKHYNFLQPQIRSNNPSLLSFKNCSFPLKERCSTQRPIFAHHPTPKILSNMLPCINSRFSKS
jgi:hypothetical protein